MQTFLTKNNKVGSACVATQFTLVELMVVLFIVSFVCVGVVVAYSGIAEDSRKQTTLHEMNEIKNAFSKFYQDNYTALHKSLPDHEGGAMSDKMDFFSTYGLWPLLQRKIVNEGCTIMEFDEYDPVAEAGWNGPYLNSPERETLDPKPGGFNFPQIADQYGDYYRIVNLDHTSGAKTYKRLLLVCTYDGVLDIGSGNNNGSTTNRIDFNTGIIKITDETNNNDIVVEILNEDN